MTIDPPRLFFSNLNIVPVYVVMTDCVLGTLLHLGISILEDMCEGIINPTTSRCP